MTNTTLIPRTVVVIAGRNTEQTKDGRAKFGSYATHAILPGHTSTACGRFTDEEVRYYPNAGNMVECKACQKDLRLRGIAP